MRMAGAQPSCYLWTMRVAICYSTRLFGQGLACLLRDAGGIEVVAAVPVDQLHRTQVTPPVEAVLVEENAGGSEETAAALRVLHARPDARLIRVNSETAVLDLSGRLGLTAGGGRLLAVLSERTGSGVRSPGKG